MAVVNSKDEGKDLLLGTMTAVFLLHGENGLLEERVIFLGSQIELYLLYSRAEGYRLCSYVESILQAVDEETGVWVCKAKNVSGSNKRVAAIAVVGTSGKNEGAKAKTSTESYHVEVRPAAADTLGESEAIQVKNYTESPRENIVSLGDDGVAATSPVAVRVSGRSETFQAKTSTWNHQETDTQ